VCGPGGRAGIDGASAVDPTALLPLREQKMKIEAQKAVPITDPDDEEFDSASVESSGHPHRSTARPASAGRRT